MGALTTVPSPRKEKRKDSGKNMKKEKWKENMI